MRKFLIATHGNFAEGIKSSLELIIGTTDNLFTIGAYTNGNQSIEEDLAEVLNKVGPEDELVVFTDLLGGSITNQVLKMALRPEVHVVSGFNLALLIEIILGDDGVPVDELLETSIQNAKNQMVYVNKILQTKQEDNLDD